MAEAKYDVLGIGNAIFDVLVKTDEQFLSRHGMTLIDEARAASIYRDMGPATEMSGGSAANTIVGIAGFGARAAYVGKVKNDQIGKLYTHDIRAAGVAFDTALNELRKDAKLGVVARSEKGCVVASRDGVVAVPAFAIDRLVDTTGAGDLFAAGFLFGLVRNAGYENAGRLGALAAAEVIQHIGARPQVSLKELAKQNGLPV